MDHAQAPSGVQDPPIVHARRLKQAHDNDPALFPGRVPPEPPPIDAEDNQYIVEAIPKSDPNHRTIRRKRQFLVHWEGYADIEDSWVKEGDIDPEMVKVYLEGLEKDMTSKEKSKSDNKAHKVDIQNTTPSPVLRRGRSARTQPNPDT